MAEPYEPTAATSDYKSYYLPLPSVLLLLALGEIREPNGAGERNRTINLLITNQLHYRLCYTSILCGKNTEQSAPFT